MSCKRRGAETVLLALGLTAWASRAAAAEPAIRKGCVETAFSASLSSVAGDTRVLAAVSGTRFGALPRGLWSAGLEAGYTHVAGLDAWEIEAQAGWSLPVGASVMALGRKRA